MNRALVKKVLKEHAQSNLPGPPNLWPAIREAASQADAPPAETVRLLAAPAQQRGRRTPVSTKALLLGGLSICLLLAVSLGVLSSLRNVAEPPPASAAEVLARADAAGQGTNDIRSTHMTLTIRSRNNLVDPFVEAQSERWNQAPNKSRMVTTWRTADGVETHFLVGSDGAARYLYSDNDHEFRIYLQDWSAVTDLASATQQASRNADMRVYDAMLVGTEMVGTRLTYVLELALKPGLTYNKTQLTPFHQRRKLWIDEQTYLILREQDWEAAGNLVYEAQYQHLDINPALEPSFFAPTPPANAIVADMRPASPDEVAVGWHEATGQSMTPLFQATKYPDWMVPGRPYYAAGQGIVSQAFVMGQHTQGGVLSMVISQGPPGAASLSAPDWGSGQGMQIGPLSGRIYSKRQAYILIFDRAGTRIKIYLPAVAVVNSGQLRQIAQSLQPAPR